MSETKKEPYLEGELLKLKIFLKIFGENKVCPDASSYPRRRADGVFSAITIKKQPRDQRLRGCF